MLSGYDSLWIRQAKPYSGDTYGWRTLLTDDTEVGIAYDSGDIGRPYIAHYPRKKTEPDISERHFVRGQEEGDAELRRQLSHNRI